MARYLLNLSYIGTTFRGLQKQRLLEGLTYDSSTVQGCVEMALISLKPLKEPETIISSRTDAGVHALHTTMHVDLTTRGGKKYDPTIVTLQLNKYFNKHSLPIRILKTYIVPDNFHCRRALARTYMYRLGVIKVDPLNQSNLLEHVPIEELQRCLYICTSTFDVDKFKDAAKLFVGYHDFRSFMYRESRYSHKITRRTVEFLDIEEVGNTYYSRFSWPLCIDKSIGDYKLYNIYMKANGFLYNQVRRTVASLIAVAQGKVTSRDIKFMIEVPSRRSWDSRIKTVPAHGLYLCEVAYSKPDLDTFADRLGA